MDPLPPDPYAALGVPKDASPATIKSTYRKLVLTCHPDKVKDESLKQQKQEEFHKIQSAYELIGDEEKRATYDAQARLDKLRSEKAARNGGADVDIKTAGYKVRTEAPKGASFTAHGPARYDYEERKPARSYDDDRYFEDRSSSRKYPSYDAYPKHTSSSSRTARPEREPVRVAKPADRTRSDRTKTRDRQERSDRSGKYAHMEDESSSNDERARYEAEYRRRSDEDRRRRDEEEMREAARKEAANARKKAEDRRSYDEPKQPRRHHSDEGNFDRQRKMSDMASDAIKHIYRTSVEPDPRPSPSRTSSSREIPRERVDSYSRRPEPVRRSSAAPRKDRPQASGRDRKGGYPEIVEWEEDKPSRPPPSFTQSKSSPADIQLPHPGIGRSYTEATPRDHRREKSPTAPSYRRADTLPSMPSSSSSRRKDATVTRPSGLRSSESAPPREADEFPSVPPPRTSSSTKYYYPTSGGGVSLRQEHVDVANSSGHHTVLAEPSRHRNRSPSPLARPPIGANRPVEKTTSQPRSMSSVFSPPPLGRSSTFNDSAERGRSDRLYREIPSDYHKREPARRQTSYSPDTVAYARKPGPEDIQWAGGREAERNMPSREYASKPSFGRTATYVF